MRTLSSVALASAHAQETDEVWLTRLRIEHASLPGGKLQFVSDMRDLTTFPASDLMASLKDISAWAGGVTVSQIGRYYKLTDTSSGAIYRNQSVAISASTLYTFCVQVQKDDDTSRVAGVQVNFGVAGAVVYLNTKTGAYSSTGPAGSTFVIAEGSECWYVFMTVTSEAGASTAQVYLFPAVGTVLGSTSGAAQGSTCFRDPRIWAGAQSLFDNWIAYPFQIDLPGEDAEQPAVARLRIDNVDRRIVQEIRGLSTPPTADLEVVLASQPSTVEIGFYDMTLRAADFDSLYVEGTLTMEEIFSEPVSLEMTPSRFPSLF